MAPLAMSEIDTLLKMGFQIYIFCSKCRKRRFTDPNFENYPGGMPPDPPRFVSSPSLKSWLCHCIVLTEKICCSTKDRCINCDNAILILCVFWSAS